MAFGCGGARPVADADGRTRWEMEGVELAVEFGQPRGEVTAEALDAWVRRATLMVSDYCGGQFPVPRLDVDIVTRSGGGLGWGQHWGGERVMAMAGGRTTLRGLRRDWVLVHEMLHLAYPSLPRRQRWMREGMSTYLETVVRARCRVLDEEEVWRRWCRQMPLGLSRPGDRGFDLTPSWGSIYWGGALFWLRVDVELRRATEGRLGLRELVIGTLARGGDARRTWRIPRVLRTAEEITGTPVVADLYAQMALAPTELDLFAWFAELGVDWDGENVQLRDDAPLAAIRRAMNAPEGPPLPPMPGAPTE